jgi:hypothetical protein
MSFYRGGSTFGRISKVDSRHNRRHQFAQTEQLPSKWVESDFAEGTARDGLTAWVFKLFFYPLAVTVRSGHMDLNDPIA